MKSIGQTLIITVIPASIIWYPLLNISGIGNLSISDLNLIILNVITLITYAFSNKTHKECNDIIFLTLLIALSSTCGSILFNGKYGPLQELSMFFKRFGLAAIIPLSISLYGTKKILIILKYEFFILLVLMFVFSTNTYLQSFLPIWSLGFEFNKSAIGARATGLVTNPNDFAYISFLLAATIVALSIGINKVYDLQYTLQDNVIYLFAILIGIYNVIASGSRSGLMGLLFTLFYLILKKRTNLLFKMLSILAITLILIAGWSLSDEFQERIESALSNGAKEENVSSRIDAQLISLEAFFNNPLGVGFNNFKEATQYLSRGNQIEYIEGSDSLYIDTLLGAGVLGVTALFILLYKCIKYTSKLKHIDIYLSRVVYAGIVSVCIFGLSTIIPMSVFVSPIFFMLVSMSSLSKIKKV